MYIDHPYQFVFIIGFVGSPFFMVGYRYALSQLSDIPVNLCSLTQFLVQLDKMLFHLVTKFFRCFLQLSMLLQNCELMLLTLSLNDLIYSNLILVAVDRKVCCNITSPRRRLLTSTRRAPSANLKSLMESKWRNSSSMSFNLQRNFGSAY